jgi:hypothetical protein
MFIGPGLSDQHPLGLAAPTGGTPRRSAVLQGCPELRRALNRHAAHAANVLPRPVVAPERPDTVRVLRELR